MAHIICITSGLRGLLNASFELTNRLQKAGHQVTYACPHDVRESVEAQQLNYVQLPSVNFDPAPPPARTDGSVGARIDEWRSAGARREAGIEAMNLEPFRAFVRAEKPDLVLIDVELYEHIFTLYDMRTPMALITPFFASWRAPGVPPLPLDTRPGHGWRGTTPGLLLTWWQRRVQRFKAIKLISLRNAFTERRSVLKTLARKVGYPTAHLEEYGSHTLFNDNHLPVLHLTASELEFGAPGRADVHYVGPMVALQRVDESVTAADRARLQALYQARAAAGGKLLYCSTTTMSQSDTDFLKRVVEAAAQNPEWTLIVVFSDAAPIADPPDNVHAFCFVPQIEVLAHADVCITYGGINTVHECLTQKVPLLVYPRFHDQPGVAARLVHHGLAHRGDVEDDSANVIAQRITAVLNDDELVTRLAGMSEILHRYERDDVAADVVAKLLG